MFDLYHQLLLASIFFKGNIYIGMTSLHYFIELILFLLFKIGAAINASSLGFAVP